MSDTAVLSSELFAGIKTLWTATANATTLAGISGPYRNREPAKAARVQSGAATTGEDVATFPYVVVKSRLHAREHTTNVSELWRHLIVLEVRHNSLANAETAAKAVASVFDKQLPVLADGAGRILDVRRLNDGFEDEDEGVGLVQLTYQYRQERPRAGVGGES